MNGALIIKVGDKPSNAKNGVDGRVISAISHRRCLQVDASHICHVKRAGKLESGLRPVSSMAYLMQSTTYQYEFARYGDEVLRTELRTGEQQVFGKKPRIIGGKPQHINVREYLKRRLKHDRHRIFGLPGEEIWFGGREDFSLETMQLLWNKITLRTGQRPTWGPFGWLENRYHLVLPLEQPLDQSVADELQGQDLPWRSLVPLSLVKRIEDKSDLVCLYCLGYACNLRTVARKAG